MVDIHPIGHLANPNRFHSDNMTTFGGGQDCRHQILRQFLARDDHGPRPRIAENVGVVARRVGRISRNRHTAGGHDREVGNQPFRPVFADERHAVARLEPDPL